MRIPAISPEIFAGLHLSQQRYYQKELTDTGAKMSRIVDNVCNALGLDRSQVISASRKKENVFARYIAINEINDSMSVTLKEIGDFMAGRDHSTVITALQTFEDLNTYDKRFKALVASYKRYVAEKERAA